MQKNKTNFQKNNKFNKQHRYNYNKNKNKFYYKNKKHNIYYRNKFYYKNKKHNIYYLLGEKRPTKPLITTYLYRNKKIKKGIFFKEPTFKSILYPFHLNLKLINEYLKKK